MSTGSVHACTGHCTLWQPHSEDQTWLYLFRWCQKSDMDTFLAASCGHGLSWRTVMLQGSGSYFAYEPVLKALQPAEMPLQHLLPLPASQEDAVGKRSQPSA